MIKLLFNPKTPVLVTVLALLAAIIAVWFAPSELHIHFTNGHATGLSVDGSACLLFLS